MLFRILKKDFQKNRGVTSALVIFIIMASLLVASGTSVIFELSNSINYLFAKSHVPHFLAKHSGTIDRKEIDGWALDNYHVHRHQVTEMLNIDGSNIYLGGSATSERDSVMTNDFVKQNPIMDIFVNLKGEVVDLAKGEIAVPIYYMQSNNLHIGDTVRVVHEAFDMDFTIIDFIRDALMNPALVHSKRFVVSNDDYEELKRGVGETEYLIEFQLNDVSELEVFRNEYQASNLPQNGPLLDVHLIKMLNAISDGVVVAVMFFISILLTIIAFLCIRFTILATLEEDYREVGVMKAIGVRHMDIKRIYLVKYMFIAIFGTMLGYLASLVANKIFIDNIKTYLGEGPQTIFSYFIPLVATMAIGIIMVVSCAVVLRKIGKISPIEALRGKDSGASHMPKRYLSLHAFSRLPANIFLGIQEVYQRLRKYLVMFFIFFLCSFIIIIPIDLFNTIKSPTFITYMGIGRTDIRIDLAWSDDVFDRFNTLTSYLENDRDVAQYSPLVTSRYEVINDEGVPQNMNIETGDFTKFPLKYLSGSAPERENEIALSYLYSKELNKSVGDTITLIQEQQEKAMKVTGVYQDISWGGLTAKAALPFNHDTAAWYVVNVDLMPGVAMQAKIQEYTNIAKPARVQDLDAYLSQTLGSMTNQLFLFTLAAIVIATCTSLLITYLFLKLMLARQWSQIAIMRALGFSLNHIRLQYITRVLLVLIFGIIAGTIFESTVGQSVVNLFWSLLGASRITFIIDPIQVYVIVPILLISVVVCTSLISLLSVRKAQIVQVIQE